MTERIERAPVAEPVRFVVAGDSGAWPDPTAEAVFVQLVTQVGALDPAPLFFANLGDFAGPGTVGRHEDYLRVVEALPMPAICVVGNHDLDDPGAADAFTSAHGPFNFTFAHGGVRFVALHGEPGEVGEIETSGADGPRQEDLEFLDRALRAAGEPHRVVLLHQPPYLDGHYAPHADWGFRLREREFLELLREHGVTLVCCAHGLAFDTVVRDGIRFVMSGGGGTGLCSHFGGICTDGPGRPEDRGALYHAVELTITSEGAISGRVLQAFAPPGEARITF